MKKRNWLIIGVVSFFYLVSLIGLRANKAKIVDFVGLKLVGATVENIDPDTLTIADLSDIPGVTQEYVEAYKMFLRAKAGDSKEFDYREVVSTFEKIARATKNPELKLRSLFLVTFCNFIQMKIDEAYRSGVEVLKLSKSLYKDDKRVILADKFISTIQKGEISEVEVLKELIEWEGEDILGIEKAKEVTDLVEEFYFVSQKNKEYEVRKKKIIE